MVAKRFQKADILHGKATKTDSVLEYIQFHGVKHTQKTALLKETSKLFESKNVDELITNSSICAKHLQTVGLFENCVPFVDVSTNIKNGYVIHFATKEPKAFQLGVKMGMTSNGEADASLNAGKQSVNGRGESIDVSYSKAMAGSNSFDMTFNKPLLGWQRYENVGFSVGNPFQHLTWNSADLSETFATFYYNRRFFNNKLGYNVQMNASWRKFIPTEDSPFPIRDQAGHTMKLSFEESYTIDSRDRPILASKGILAKYCHEYAGILGDAVFFKNQLDLQASAPFIFGSTLSASIKGLHINSFGNSKLHLLDSAYLGGPYDVRGFEMKSIGTRADHACLGGATAVAATFHLYRPLIPADSLFLHAFMSCGSVARVGSKTRIQDLLDVPRVSTGIGIAFLFRNAVRLEFNYVLPIRYVPGDAFKTGFQFGAGINFL